LKVSAINSKTTSRKSICWKCKFIWKCI
jgi:hypothetical protein